MNVVLVDRCVLSRWYGQSRLSTEGISEVAKPFVAKIFEPDMPATTRTQTEQEKYRRMQQAFGRISGELALFNDEAFDTAMKQFDEWWHSLRQGHTTIDQTIHSGSGERRDHDEGGGGAGCTDSSLSGGGGDSGGGAGGGAGGRADGGGSGGE
ncbi:hypothetical protein PF006_g32606 [Phytophthora fragariae]|uniref:Uncharacterized protein n=1 Tax=Phytophthora fragariae TaxID=53985 RepID=A0A6A3PRC1_9STRA|nr:hypothetical protein PF006_g32606 [Phytophthora fragariae]